MEAQTAHRGRVILLAGLLLCLGIVVSEAQPVSTAIRVVSPPDGATFEPGAPVTVVVEPEGPTPLQEVIIATPGVIQRAVAAPFQFTFPAPQELGPKKLAVAAQDQKNKEFLKELTYHVETATPVTSIQVTSPPLFISTEREISVFGIFADGIRREITRSQEITYSSSNPQVATVTSDGTIEAVDNGTATITVTYKGQMSGFPVKVDFQKFTVPIDIKPDDPRNTVNVTAKGRLPVAILSTPTFDATTVNHRRVKFGPAGALPDLEHVKTQDVNRDGQPDLVLRFRIQETGIQCGQTTATLTGVTVLGDRVSGTDTIRVVGKACP